MRGVRIGDLKKAVEGTRIRLSASVAIGQEPAQTLWFDVDPAFADFVAETADPFILCLLPRAIQAGMPITVDAPASARLLHSINNGLGSVLATFFRSAPVQVSCSAPSSVDYNGKAVLTGFSGGVDSFCAYRDHGPQAPEPLRITHFITNNTGQHGPRTPDSIRVFNERVEKLSEFAKTVGIPLIVVDSNAGTFIPGHFQHTHTLRNAAAALVLQKGVGGFLYASAYAFDQTAVRATNDIAYMDPVILPLLGTESLRCYPTGAQHSRVQKTIAVAEIPASRRYLDVCTRTHLARDGQPNCGICWKCMRTQTTLDAAGLLADFDGVFPLERYRNYRKLYLLEVIGSKDPLTSEVRDLVKKQRYDVPIAAKAIAPILPQSIARNIARAFPTFHRKQWVAKIANRLL